MPYKSAYLTGCAILAFFWLLFYITRKDLRKEMFWASMVGLPFGIMDYFLVPAYWHPDSLFGLIPKYGVGIESFLFIFLMSGICSAIYEYVFEKKLVKIRSGKTHIFGIFSPLALLFVLILIFPGEAIYNFIFVGAIGNLLILFLRKDLWLQSIFSGLLFGTFYVVIFYIVGRIFPGLAENIYSLDNMWGIFIAGVPAEEIVAGVFVGSFWSMSYEYVKGYRLR